MLTRKAADSNSQNFRLLPLSQNEGSNYLHLVQVLHGYSWAEDLAFRTQQSLWLTDSLYYHWSSKPSMPGAPQPPSTGPGPGLIILAGICNGICLLPSLKSHKSPGSSKPAWLSTKIWPDPSPRYQQLLTLSGQLARRTSRQYMTRDTVAAVLSTAATFPLSQTQMTTEPTSPSPWPPGKPPCAGGPYGACPAGLLNWS